MEPVQSGNSHAGTNKMSLDDRGIMSGKMASAIADTATSIGDGLGKVKDQLVKSARDEKDQIQELGERASQRGAQMMRRAETMVRRRPLMSLAVAAGVAGIAVFTVIKLTNSSSK